LQVVWQERICRHPYCRHDGAGVIAMEWKFIGKATTLGAASGAVAGLATVTPASGFVGPLSAALIGIAAGGGCYLWIKLKNKFGYDDSLDVVGIHGVGGVLGLFATGLFASKAVNPNGADGLFCGNPSQLGIQLIAIVVTIIYAFVGTFVILKSLTSFSVCASLSSKS
jgi:Amt family ammonium transporter